MKLALKIGSISLGMIVLHLLAMTQSHANMTLAQKVLKPVIQYQCDIELNTSKLWKWSTFLMTTPNKAQLQKEVCECVATNALNDISTQDLLKATLNEQAKNAVAKQAALNSIKSCIVQSKQ